MKSMQCRRIFRAKPTKTDIFADFTRNTFSDPLNYITMVKIFSPLLAICAVALSVLVSASPLEKRSGTFNPACNNNVVLYWGQDSAAGGGLTLQGPLRQYCDGNSDILVLAFVTKFHDSTGYPVLNFANQCDPVNNFNGTNLVSRSSEFFAKHCANIIFMTHFHPSLPQQLHCPAIGADIKYCQSKGKIVLLSLGGWTSETIAPDATAFADQLWNLFGEGSSPIRPFDDAHIDGFDWDIEHDPGTDMIAIANRLTYHYKTASKKYYMTAAPFCSGLSTQAYNAAFLKNIYVDFVSVRCGVIGY
ncbi:glycoside hydrolase superfamily [Jimgerdemannia flammicorona]|uniref:Glycoside hydrolase superfamily n=1 Tax=Jimgerdemannia flammicorona TaxID=994334 RepID=A0A433R007_9FUNG|nr:glycoside hydrolase superfamily [Jimgerdemannia flammicorona]